MLHRSERPRRGFRGQRERRELERETRMHAVAFGRWALKYDLAPRAAAEKLGLSAETLREWDAIWRAGRLELVPRGRPVAPVDRGTREEMIAMFMMLGPGVGVRTWPSIFPQLPRRELEDFMRRWTGIHTRKNGILVHVLRWRRTGSVWAMDFTDPPQDVDGKYSKILVVRDLSSGKTLGAQPLVAEGSKATRDLLVALCFEHGVPLVIKSDNGSSFIAEELQKFLLQWFVWQLLSPPGTPEYNGACEAGIGGIKTRAHELSARHDRPGEWTCDDVEGARLMANQTARPYGAAGMTPDEAWTHWRPISTDERADFEERVMKYRDDEMRNRTLLPGMEIRRGVLDSTQRVAISRALVASGILDFRRRRIPLAI
jgi:hypothetical protein